MPWSDPALLVALLAVLGVDLIVIVVLLAFVLSRRRWVSHEPGAFRGAIRIADGAIDGLGPEWSRGYGRWARDVLVWTKAPFLLRNEILATDRVEDQRSARPGEVNRLGDDAVVVRVRSGAATADVAAAQDECSLVARPYRESSEPAPITQPAAASRID